MKLNLRVMRHFLGESDALAEYGETEGFLVLTRWLNKGKHMLSPNTPYSPQLFPVPLNNAVHVAGLLLTWGYLGGSVNNPLGGI